MVGTLWNDGLWVYISDNIIDTENLSNAKRYDENIFAAFTAFHQCILEHGNASFGVSNWHHDYCNVGRLEHFNNVTNKK